MIFQDPMTALNPIDTVGDQICETIRLHERFSSGCGKAGLRCAGAGGHPGGTLWGLSASVFGRHEAAHCNCDCTGLPSGVADS